MFVEVGVFVDTGVFVCVDEIVLVVEDLLEFVFECLLVLR